MYHNIRNAPLQKREIIASIGVPILIIAIGIGVFYLKWWKLTEVTSAVLLALVGGIVGLIVFGFKHRFETSKQEISPTPELTVEYDEKNIKQFSPFVDGHRVLRIRVRNKGDEEAKECEARVEAFNYAGSRLTEEIYVIWTKNNVTKSNIPKHDSVFLNVVFSTKDSIDGHLAFIAHPKSSDFSKAPRLNEGLKVGNYKLKIRIKPPNSDEALYTNFDLHVKENWEEISMSKIDEYLHSE